MIVAHLPEEEVVAPPHFVPTDMQRCFLSCPADQTLYGGAAAGGKTASLVMAGMRLCMALPGTKAIYFRLTFDDLQQQIDETKRFVPHNEARFHETRHRWEFVPKENPYDHLTYQSYFSFRYLKSESDALGHFSREYDLLIFDEATQFSQKTIELLSTRNRTSLPGGRARLLMGTNPGGIGHLYLFENWVEPKGDDYEIIAQWDWNATADDGTMGRWIRTPNKTGRVGPFMVWRPHPNDEQRAANELPLSRCFIPAKVDDNPHADPSYKRRLMGLQDEHLKRALLYGDWHVFSGQAFSEFSEVVHVRNDIEVEPHWRRWRSIDWGWSTSATAVYWHAYNPDKDQVITYRELYMHETPDKELCERILTNSPKLEYVDFTVADPSMWAGGSNERGLSRADIFAQYGVPLTRAINKRPTGFARVKQAMSINPKTKEPYWVCTPECFNLRRTIPTLIYDKSGEDIDHSGAVDDHCLAQGTLVLTPDGWIPIETIAGARIMRYDASIIRLITEDGMELRCTPDHKIMTTHGWVEAQFLHQGSLIRWYSPGPLNSIGEPVTTSADRTISETGLGSTERYGRIITGLSRAAIMSTTEITTAPTIPLGISNYSQSENISVVIPVNPLIAKGRRGEIMRFATPAKAIADCQRSNGVKRLSGVTHENVNVNVWDISVDHPLHGFVAGGGFIVHNCYDTLRYGLLATPAFFGAQTVAMKPFIYRNY